MFGAWIRKHNRSTLDSYINLKRALGVLGILLPFICIFGGLAFAATEVQHSVSHYYHTNMRDALVGLLGCVAIFLMTYTGYGLIDNLVSWAIGLAGAGVILFPCPTDPMTAVPVGIFHLPQEVSGTVHLICAGAFFFLLAVNSIFLFTISSRQSPGRKKLIRNAIYIICGCVILASLAALLIFVIFANDLFSATSIGLVFETIMLFAFGVSWLVKGGVPFLRDTPVPANSP